MAFSFGNDWTETKFTENKTKAHEIATALYERAAVIGMDVDQNRWKFLIAGDTVTNFAGSYVLTKGVESANDYTATHEQNSPRHEHTKDAGDSTFDLYYQFECGADKTIKSIFVDGHAKNTGVNFTVAVYNWTTSAWDTITTLTATAGDTDETSTFTTATRHHILNDGINDGRVRIRFSSAAASGGTLKVDYLFVAAEPAKANPDLADYDGFEAILTEGRAASKGVLLIHQFRDAIEDLIRFNNDDRASGAQDNWFDGNVDSGGMICYWWDSSTNIKTLANLLDKGSYGSDWNVADDLDGVRLHENDAWEQIREALGNMMFVTWIFGITTNSENSIMRRTGADASFQETAWDNAIADTPVAQQPDPAFVGSTVVPVAMWKSTLAGGNPFVALYTWKTGLDWNTANISGDALSEGIYSYYVQVDQMDADFDMSDTDGNAEAVSAGNSVSLTNRTEDKTLDPWPNIDGTDTTDADATIDTAEPADIPFDVDGFGTAIWYPRVHSESGCRCRTELEIGIGKILSIG